jgi:hypothetical protein
MPEKHWSCPYCNHDTIIQSNSDYMVSSTDFRNRETESGYKRLYWDYIVCPNKDCRKYSLSVCISTIKFDKIDRDWKDGGKADNNWLLIPPSKAKTFPNFIPQAILDDYNEACLIVNYSPKASATLSRRCLQGIIRDFWKVNTGKLVYEIDQIKDRIDPLTLDAIDAVRSVGNIGAHMEEDINIILDVEPEEAELLIGLIEILLKDWYIAKEDKQKHLLETKELAKKKKNMKNPD